MTVETPDSADRDGESVHTVVPLLTWSETVPSSPKNVADALRRIATQIEDEQLCLISIYSTGFGGPADACLQVIVDDLGDEPLPVTTPVQPGSEGEG
jgi:hypothetical protein